MSENLKHLINSIHAGDSVETQNAFESEMMTRIADRMDTFRQNVASNLFRDSDTEQQED